jgi:NTE family protein
VPDADLPDVLVLAAGGVLGEAWMNGVLAGLEDAAGFDLRRVESFVGTSAGSIVAARLAAGRRPRRPRERPPTAAAGARAPERSELDKRDGAGDGPRGLRGAAREAARWGWAATAPLAPLALGASAPGGALVRSAVLARAPSRGRRLDDLRGSLARSGVRFDGRLRVCCVERASGRRVIFGAPGAPPARVADAVAASCAIPWVFAPVEIGGREYVDGGVWSATNLDAAPARRGTHVLCLDPIAGAGPGPLRRAVRVAVELELQLLRARGARVRHVTPAPEAAATMGDDLMASAPAAAVLAAGYRQGLDALTP